MAGSSPAMTMEAVIASSASDEAIHASVLPWNGLLRLRSQWRGRFGAQAPNDIYLAAMSPQSQGARVPSSSPLTRCLPLSSSARLPTLLMRSAKGGRLLAC